MSCGQVVFVSSEVKRCVHDDEMFFEGQPADVLSYVGYSQSHCGYCGQDQTSESIGFWAHSLTAGTYQNLIDRGWRRSGCYLYRPNNRRTCCKLYTVRLDAKSFKAEKKHRQALNKFNRYVIGPEAQERLSRIKINEEPSSSSSATFNLHRALQMTELCNTRPDISPAHNLVIEFTGSEYSDEKFSLYKKYQIGIHGDKPDEIKKDAFKRFLCETPIVATQRPKSKTEPADLRFASGKRLTYGSCHQLYRLDGKLFALAILDILPSCVSSVYFIYDPDYGHLSLGRVSALRELALAQSLDLTLPQTVLETQDSAISDTAVQQISPGGWYYMGFFSPVCEKLKYKGEYTPTFVLDPCCTVTEPQWSTLEQYIILWSLYGKDDHGKERLVSLLEPESVSRKQDDVDFEGLEYMDMLKKTDMPGLAPLDLQHLQDVKLLENGYVTFLRQLVGAKRPEMLQQLATLAAVIGLDILLDAIVTV